jgi:hypothetical protein
MEPGDMIREVNTKAQRVQVGDVQVGHAEQEEFEAKSTGISVSVPNSMHGRSNFVIEQTKGYTEKKLKKFLYCPGFFPATIAALAIQGIVCFICSIVLGTAGRTVETANLATLGLSLIVLVSCVILLFIYAQHVYVSCNTIPVVLENARAVEMNLVNAHIKTDYTSKESAYVKDQNIQIGAQQEMAVSGKTHFLSKTTVAAAQNARISSTFIFIVLFLLFFWSAGTFLASVIQANTAIGY